MDSFDAHAARDRWLGIAEREPEVGSAHEGATAAPEPGAEPEPTGGEDLPVTVDQVKGMLARGDGLLRAFFGAPEREGVEVSLDDPNADLDLAAEAVTPFVRRAVGNSLSAGEKAALGVGLLALRAYGEAGLPGLAKPWPGTDEEDEGGGRRDLGPRRFELEDEDEGESES